MSKIIYELYKNNNSHNKGYGKYYARVRSTETMNTRQLARHIAGHGTVWTEDLVYGVMNKAFTCLKEQLLESKRVKIDGLGTFYLTVKSTGETDADKFTIGSNVKGLRIRFLPDGSTEEQLTSRTLLRRASFINIEQLKAGGKDPATGDGGTGGDTGSGSTGGGDGGGNNTGSGSEGGADVRP